LDWSPKTELQAGLRKTVQWYLANMDWIDGLSKTHDFNEWTKANYGNREEGK
jgi:dTDP-glucose 4,6-dehydratase